MTANWKYHHTRIIRERNTKPHQPITVATTVMPKETQPITMSVLSALGPCRKLAANCHSTSIMSSRGKKKFIKAFGTNSNRQAITNKAVKMVGR